VGELIFFAVLIFFSILESVARQRKQRQGGGAEPSPLPGSEPLPREGERSAAGRTARAGDEDREQSAETVLPADLWEEIAGLAAGGLPEAPPETAPRRPRKPADGQRRRPERSRPRPLEGRRERGASADRAARGSERRPTRWTPSTTGAHPIHEAHRDYGTAPSERPPSQLDWKPPATGNENAKRVRALLRGSGGTDALKQAVMIQEILGMPVSMKDR
jgi:hypothetical protein